MKLSQVQQKLFDSYHGNPVQALLPAVKECLSGNQGFDSLWDRGEENSSLTLKSCMTQKDDVLYTSGTSFNQLSLSTAHQSMQVLIDGRALYSLATTALKIGKKALSVELSAYKDGKLPTMKIWISLYSMECGRCLQGHQCMILIMKGKKMLMI